MPMITAKTSPSQKLYHSHKLSFGVLALPLAQYLNCILFALLNALISSCVHLALALADPSSGYVSLSYLALLSLCESISCMLLKLKPSCSQLLKLFDNIRYGTVVHYFLAPILAFPPT